MPPQAGQPVKSPQVVIDLTLSDNEDVSYVQPRFPHPSAHTASLLLEIPSTRHGLPMFTTNADRKSEKRNGASGMNYAENPLPNGFGPLAAAPDCTQPRSGSRFSGRSNNRNHTSANLKNLSNKRVNLRSPQKLVNTAKRRKTTHDGVHLGGRGRAATSVSLGARSSPSSSLHMTNQPVDLTLSHPTTQTRTVITGANRLRSSYRPPHSPEERLTGDSIELDNLDNHSMSILQQVFGFIKQALQTYHGDLSPTDRKEITTKTAAWLIRPELKIDYESNNGQFSEQYRRAMTEEAKAYVESYVETRRELNSRSLRQRLGASEESEGPSSSSAPEDIFERHHPYTHLDRSHSYSESPTTELSNDQLAIDQLDGARGWDSGRKRHVNFVTADGATSLRRSERASRSQASYSIGRKRRRKNEQTGKLGHSARNNDDTMPNDLDYESENPVADPDSDPRDELAGIKAVARTMQAPPKKPDTIPSEKDLLSLLRHREMHGRAPVRVASGRTPFKAVIYANWEDAFIRQSEWTDCSGDIQTICWINEDAFLCGATAHLDSHNMEYNKPGNLLLGSTTYNTLRSFANHRVPRPIPDMLQDSEHHTQDPWLYSSVVSTAHCKKNGFSFTASFDETVNVWSIHEDGSSMELVGTWKHGGKVNFVVASDHHKRVATATGISSNAVRVYNFDEKAISESFYDLYGGNKALLQTEDDQQVKPWSYQPATIQWGKAAQVANLLLVGYSPRSDTGDDADIPDEKKNTGELCVWNTETGNPVHISASHTQNVFEVQWHPTQPIFVAATSPSGIFDGDKTKTQIRLFALNDVEIFMNTQALDCSALDINELTIMPNSLLHCYVTASCTDGNTHVYDTARGDQPIHILRHGDPLDPLDPDLPREIGDTGVQFAAWGQTTNRFYTGSSDGMVKAWNIKAPQGRAFVRNVLSLAGAIISGAFSKEFSKLLIGDATGKVHLMSINDSDLEGGPIAGKLMNSSSEENSGKSTTENGSNAEIKLQQLLQQKSSLLSKNIKRPNVVIPHKEPPPPKGFEINQQKKQTSKDIAQDYLDKAWLEQRPGLGVFQGENYRETGWYDLKAHEDGDKDRPLLPEFHEDQQFVMRKKSRLGFELLPQVKSSNTKKHQENMKLDIDFSRMSLETKEVLNKEGAEIEGDFSHTYNYELLPKTAIWSRRKKTRSESSR